MELNKLTKIHDRKMKRVGRGYGSGKGGHTVGRGTKGQRSRTGFRRTRMWIRESKINTFPKLRGIGKRKSTRKFFKAKISKKVITLDYLNRFENGTTVDKMLLKKAGIGIQNTRIDAIKILANGNLTKKLKVVGLEASKKAIEKIKAQGGSFTSK